MEMGRLGKYLVLTVMSILVAGAFLACGGGGSDAPGSIPFTEQMVEGKTFYREDISATDPERGITGFAAGGALTDWMEDGAGASESSGNWSINGAGQLVLQVGPDNVVMTLLADTAIYMDVLANDGTTSENLRLYKMSSFENATLPGRYAAEDQDLAGSSTISGLALLLPGGTGTATDGLSDSNFDWNVNADGSATFQFSGTTEVDTLYLLADSAPPGTLRAVGVATVGGIFDHIINATLTPTPVASGFTKAMLDDSVIYVEDTSIQERVINRFSADNTYTGWSEALSGVSEDPGTWSVSASGTLLIAPTAADNVAVMLVDETAAYLDVLVNNGTSIEADRVIKTIPLVAADVAGTYAARSKDLDGTLGLPETVVFTLVSPPGTGGTGTVGADLFTWEVNADGSMTFQAVGETNVTTFYLLADSILPDQPTVVGWTADGGGNLVETDYVNLTR